MRLALSTILLPLFFFCFSKNIHSQCQVEIDGDSVTCYYQTSQTLTASPTASSTPFISYLWSTGDTTSTTTITHSGTYCVVAMDSLGCVDSTCLTVAVQNIPIFSAPSPAIICLGDSVVLEIDTVGLSNIIWVPNGSSNTINRLVDYPSSNTTYVVEAVDTGGCERRGEMFVQVDTCSTGITKIQTQNISVFPNPSNGILNIKLPFLNNEKEIKITAINGKVAQQFMVNQKEIKLDLSPIKPGAYFIQIDGYLTKKIFIE